MICNKCGFENEENLKYCGNCGKKLPILPSAQNLKKALEPPEFLSLYDRFHRRISPLIDKNYKKIFNICIYSVFGCIVFIIL